jgi:hypothetical protein
LCRRLHFVEGYSRCNSLKLSSQCVVVYMITRGSVRFAAHEIVFFDHCRVNTCRFIGVVTLCIVSVDRWKLGIGTRRSWPFAQLLMLLRWPRRAIAAALAVGRHDQLSKWRLITPKHRMYSNVKNLRDATLQ